MLQGRVSCYFYALILSLLACFIISTTNALIPSTLTTTTNKHNYRRTSASRRCSSIKSKQSNSAENDDSNDDDDDINCGKGFYKQTSPDGEVCVLDYDTTFTEDVTTSLAASLDSSSTSSKENSQYWDGLEIQNNARRKFGLKSLNLEQYIALQAESHEIAKQQIIDATAQFFTEFDTNQDGVISLAELQQGLEKRNLTRQYNLNIQIIQLVLEHFDVSGDGLLQSEEFVTMQELREQVEIISKDYYKNILANKASAAGLPNMLQNFLTNLFEDTCESNYDCSRPEVCCDLVFKKICCDSGVMNRNMQQEMQLIPVPLGKTTPYPKENNI